MGRKDPAKWLLRKLFACPRTQKPHHAGTEPAGAPERVRATVQQLRHSLLCPLRFETESLPLGPAATEASLIVLLGAGRELPAVLRRAGPAGGSTADEAFALLGLPADMRALGLVASCLQDQDAPLLDKVFRLSPSGTRSLAAGSHEEPEPVGDHRPPATAAYDARETRRHGRMVFRFDAAIPEGCDELGITAELTVPGTDYRCAREASLTRDEGTPRRGSGVLEFPRVPPDATDCRLVLRAQGERQLWPEGSLTGPFAADEVKPLLALKAAPTADGAYLFHLRARARMLLAAAGETRWFLQVEKKGGPEQARALEARAYPESQDTYLLGLLEETRRGDKDAFDEFTTMLYEEAQGVARRRLRDPDQQAEAVERAFIYMGRHVTKSAGDAKRIDRPRAWAKKVVRRACDEVAREAAVIRWTPKQQAPARAAFAEVVKELLCPFEGAEADVAFQRALEKVLGAAHYYVTVRDTLREVLDAFQAESPLLMPRPTGEANHPHPPSNTRGRALRARTSGNPGEEVRELLQRTTGSRPRPRPVSFQTGSDADSPAFDPPAPTPAPGELSGDWLEDVTASLGPGWRRDLDGAIASLPKKQREVVNLRLLFYQDREQAFQMLSQKDRQDERLKTNVFKWMAKATGKAEGTVKRLWTAAREKLCQSLEQAWNLTSPHAAE